ncbi:MAG: SprT family zinc-dependent metalloprotease [bacterium]|nr:SprT family zinc-dependent metalloprotease [bacterium]
MATRLVFIHGIGQVTLAKRRGTRNLRLSINPNGRVRVGLPYWVPYKTAINFAKERRSWISEQQILNHLAVLRSGVKVGKAHTLYFLKSPELTAIKTRLDQIAIYVSSPYDETDIRVQHKAHQACERALAAEAKTVLPYRIKSLSVLHGYPYKDLKIRKLTSRWGSCSSQKTITLSYFLMQLPWELIDYVILHELVHTRHLNHSPGFWRSLEELVPGARARQKEIRAHKPRVQPI